MADELHDIGAHGDRQAELDGPLSDSPAVFSWVPKVGIGAWSFVGFVVATAIVVSALGAVSEIVLPMTFAVVLAVIFKPLVGVLKRHKIKSSAAAGLIVLGLAALTFGVVVATVQGMLEQTDQISQSVEAAIDNAAESTEIDQATLEEAQAAIKGAEPMISDGFVTKLVEGVSSFVGLASGLILGALIMYYLLKDGSKLRRSFVAKIDPRLRDEFDDFLGDSCRTLRSYGQGRTVMSAIVAAFIGLVALLMGLPLVFTIIVANFIGGYIPYIGAFLGGGLAVIVAIGDGGIDKGVIMLLAVAASNLLLENFVEPKVMGRTLDIHPLVVLVVTALGGLLGGIVGLILAVPAWVIASDGISRLRSKGVLDDVANKAQPTLQAMLD
jgi:predicted PurR-regulated permease PerM